MEQDKSEGEKTGNEIYIPEERTLSYQSEAGYRDAVESICATPGIYKLLHTNRGRTTVKETSIIEVRHKHNQNSGRFMIQMDGDVLKQVFKALSIVDSEFVMKISQDGISIKITDPAHVEMVSVTITPDAITAMEVGDATSVVVDTRSMPKIGKGPFTISSGELAFDRTEQAAVDGRTVIDVVPYYRTIHYEQDGIVDERDTVNPDGVIIPRTPAVTDHTAVAQVDISRILSFINRAKNTSDAVTITMEGDIITFASANDTGRTTMAIEDVDIAYTGVQGKVVSSYPMPYLEAMANVFRTGNVSMAIADDYPMKLTAPIMTELGYIIEVVYLLAPRLPDPVKGDRN